VARHTLLTHLPAGAVACHNSLCGERGTHLMISTCHGLNQSDDTPLDHSVEVALNVNQALISITEIENCQTSHSRDNSFDRGCRHFQRST
jgi:hypothetical protein